MNHIRVEFVAPAVLAQNLRNHRVRRGDAGVGEVLVSYQRGEFLQIHVLRVQRLQTLEFFDRLEGQSLGIFLRLE